MKPDGCIFYRDYGRILQKDIYYNRLPNVHNISVERAVSHSLIMRKGFRCVKVLSATTYEVCGDAIATGECHAWAETDLTGLVWKFRDTESAAEFIRKES